MALVENTGNSPSTISFMVLSLPSGWNVSGEGNVIMGVGEISGVPLEVIPDKSWEGDVKRSNVKYSVGTAVKVENIKTAFKVYELVQSSEKLSNYKIAKRVGSLEFQNLLGHYKHGQNC